MLNKKIDSSSIILADTVAVNIVYKVRKIHSHCIQRLNFVADINISKLNQSTKLTARNKSVISSIFPDKLIITIIINRSNKIKIAGN